MTKTNLQKSELVVSKILEHLLNLGLEQGTRLSFNDLSLPEDYQAIFNGCCLWLIDEGIIRCSNKSQSMHGNLTLFTPMITARGFALLDQSFGVSGSKMLVGQAVKEVAGGQVSYSGIGDFFGGLLGGLTKSMGS
jgi:hypothetical protein